MASFSRESVEFSVDSLKDIQGDVSWEESRKLVWNPENFTKRFSYSFLFVFYFSLWKTFHRQKQKASIMNLHVTVTQLP